MLEQDAATPGFVSALEARAIAAVEALAPWVAALRRTAPSAPVTLFMRGGDLKAALRLASACPLIKVRAVVIADEPIEAQLRASACHPPAVAFPGELAEWLVLTRRDLPVAVVQSVQSKMSIGCARRSAPRGGEGDHGNIGTQHPAAYQYDALHKWLKRCDLPPPGAWMQLGALAPALLALQGDGRASVESTLRARALDPSSIGHCVHRLLGVTPAAIRATVGWEWWAVRFLVNARRS